MSFKVGDILVPKGLIGLGYRNAYNINTLSEVMYVNDNDGEVLLQDLNNTSHGLYSSTLCLLEKHYKLEPKYAATKVFNQDLKEMIDE